MTKHILFLILLAPVFSKSQVKIEEVRFNYTYADLADDGSRAKIIKEVPKPDTASVIYPIIVAGSKDISAKINSAIKEVVFFEEDSIGIKQALKNRIEEGIIYMEYKVVLNQDGILSLTISSQFYGAYISTWDTHFNFDLKTGEKIEIDDIVIDRDALSKIVLVDKRKALEDYKKEQDRFFKRNDLDSSDFEFNIERANECMSSVNLDKFLLTKDHLEIFDDCDFPHAVRSQSPYYTLAYSYKTISKLLRLRKLLTLK